MTTYNKEQIEEMLTPKCEYRASESLKQRIIETATKQTVSQQPKRRPLLLRLLPTGIAAAVVLVAVILLAVPNKSIAYDASYALGTAAERFDNTPAFTATIKVRTLDRQNFAHVNPDADFMAHTLIVQQSTGHWTLKKADRMVVCDGKNIWNWIPLLAHGWKHEVSDVKTIEIFAPLLDPASLLKHEEELAKKNPKAVVDKKENDNTLALTILSPASATMKEGEGDNMRIKFRVTTYSLNEIDTRREYTFDKRSNKLLSMKISEMKGGKTLLEMTDIAYNVTLTDANFYVPTDDISWADMTDEGWQNRQSTLPMQDFTGITAEDATDKLFAALNTWDIETLKAVFAEDDPKVIESTYGQYRECTLVKQDKRKIKYSEYAGCFIPCIVRLADGKEVKSTIALRNDNPLKAWICDGGL